MSMDRFKQGVWSRHNGALMCEAVALEAVAAQFGTPTYVYSRRALQEAAGAWMAALSGRDALVCFAVKANPNLAVLDVLAQAGCGFDIVSGGELARVKAAGADTRRVVFSGVGKTASEIEQALEADILCFNVESEAELVMIERVAAACGARARVSLRVNPDVDARTHPYISTGLKDNKFGIAYEQAPALYRKAAASAHLQVVGIDCHIGSQITEVAPFVDAASRVLDLVDVLQQEGIRLQHIDLGGGLGIRYRDEVPPTVQTLVGALTACIDARGHGDKTLLFEPGRAIAAHAGALLTRVILTKAGASKHFAVVDAAMNDLMRPALYDAWMDVWPLHERAGQTSGYEIVGPVCESGDWLARDRPLVLEAGDVLVLADSGAYGMSMASNYNSRPRAAEVMIDGERMIQVRARERLADLWAGESLLPRSA